MFRFSFTKIFQTTLKPLVNYTRLLEYIKAINYATLKTWAWKNTLYVYQTFIYRDYWSTVRHDMTKEAMWDIMCATTCEITFVITRDFLTTYVLVCQVQTSTDDIVLLLAISTKMRATWVMSLSHSRGHNEQENETRLVMADSSAAWLNNIGANRFRFLNDMFADRFFFCDITVWCNQNIAKFQHIYKIPSAHHWEYQHTVIINSIRFLLSHYGMINISFVLPEL